MLSFFRKYQRAFFIVFTIVIVISFSFFGTYSTLAEKPYSDPVAFVAVDGSSIPRSEVEELAMFIGTDQIDKQMFGGTWGPNFFNDGVIRKDFLQTGIAEVIAAKYRKDLMPDYVTRVTREKNFAPYKHPQAKFISATNAWNGYAPDITNNLAVLKSGSDPLSDNAFQARVNLYLAERVWPQSILKQVLHYQQNQYTWIPKDPNIDHIDMSLFGYHTTEDWFGVRFVRLVAQFIINGAKEAEKKGYYVSNEEVLADLEKNAYLSYQENKNNPNLGLANAQEYYKEQLRIMNMDQGKAIRLWKQVMLFRRLFNDVGSASLVDAKTYEKFLTFSKEFIEGDIYQFPVLLRLANFKDLQRLETYLDGVSKRNEAQLALPTSYLSVEEVSEKTPELVEKRYTIAVSEVDKRNLQTKVTLRETWNWEVDDKNWKVLKDKFPTLGVKDAKTRDERFAALEALDDKTRAAVDTFARAAIVDSHPEWLDEALKNQEPKTVAFGLRLKGGSTPIEGFENRQELFKILDTQDNITRITGDNLHYYNIKVTERSAKPVIITYSDAVQDGTVDKLLTQKLDEYYKTVRDASPELYKNAKGEWKPVSDVSDVLAEKYFAPILKAVKDQYLNSLTADQKKDVKADSLTSDLLSTRRLYTSVNDIRQNVVKNPSEVNKWVIDAANPNVTVQDQWKLEKNNFHIDRAGKAEAGYDKDQLFTLKIGEWSNVKTPANGDVSFMQIQKRGVDNIQEKLAQEMNQGHDILSGDVQRVLSNRLLQQWNLSLDYMFKNSSGEDSFEPNPS
jgi:GcvH upstream region-like protein